ncbi:hypothetical protein GGR53DRAFT_466338 [Hypoxylon sp. FL1150]|nr:hypothetical protein GGR53DRAFT_466338 [Hypoxylon sp. FL1150]
MDSSGSSDFQLTQKEEIQALQVAHEKQLAFLANMSEKEELEIREKSKSNLQLLKATVTTSQYEEIIIPMAQNSLEYDLQKLEIRRRRNVEICEKLHKDERARKEVTYHEKFVAKLAQTKQPPPATEGGVIPQHKDVSMDPNGSGRDDQPMLSNPFATPNPLPQLKLTKPLICIVQRQIIDNKPRLMMHVKSLPTKRKASESGSIDESAPKRPHLDTSLSTVNPLRTPVSTPINESRSSHQPERIITFDQVYQNGNAQFKHYIAEWPERSKEWYIVKCERHRQHFTLNPIAGAARHLNSASHGFPDRNRRSAVKELGYRVVDCDETQVRMHNKIVKEAFDNGYKPLGYKGRPRSDNIRQKRGPKVQALTGAIESRAANSGPGQENESTPERLPTESSQDSGITHPKVFHIYYGKWRVDGRKNGEFYPVMILGWDKQEGSGLSPEDTPYLHSTNLLEKSSHPPSCYKYDSTRIIGWAPGYEDGGPKVGLRKFPVMFFDVEQTVAWFPAANLSKFPLYKRKAPPRRDHPFNAARRWIAEREGFDTWEDREKSRLNALATRPRSMSAEYPPKDVNPLGCSDDSDESCSGSDAESTGSTETEKMLKKLQERGGEISDDDDYSESASDFNGNCIDHQEMDDSLDFEKEDWNRDGSHEQYADSTNSRPWAFYQLRRTDGNCEMGHTVDSHEARQAQEPRDEQKKSSMTSESTDPQRHEKSTRDANSQSDTPDMLRGNGDPRVSPSRNREEEMPSTYDVVPKLSSYNKAYNKETAHSPEDGPNSVPVSPDGQVISDHLLGTDEQALVEQTLGEENTRTRGPTTPCIEPTASTPKPAAPCTEAMASGVTYTTSAVIANDIADAKSDYELSLFSNGVTSWKRPHENDDCIKLFCSADRKKMATKGGHITIIVDPREMIGFSREPLPGSNGNSILTLRYKCGSTWRVVFDRNKQSKLEIGKIQTRGFIRWLRSVNADIKCFES